MTSPVKKAPQGQRATMASPKPVAEVEVGVSAHLPFVTPYRNLWEALREEDHLTVRQLASMRRTDGQARALYRLIVLPIRAALKTATYQPEDHTDGGEEEAEFIEQMFTLPANAGGMEVSFGRVIAQLLLAVFDGFSAFEMVYWSPKSGPLKGKWTMKEIAHRPSETLTFLLDDRGKYAGLRQQTMFHGEFIDKKLPAEHTFWYAANEEERPFYGVSYFQSAWYHWDKKFKLYVIAHIAAQRAAVGTRVGKLPPNPSDVDKREFKKALADLGVAQYMTIPDTYTVESLKEAAGFDFLSYINHHNSQMSKSVLAAFFDKDQGGSEPKLVDFGEQSDALFMLMLQTLMSEIEEVINTKVIPRFIDWNFSSGKYPVFRFGQLTSEQKDRMFELFKTLAVGGQSLTIRPELVHELEKQVSEELGLEIDWETIEEEMDRDAEEAAQQQLLQQEAGLMPGADGAPGAGGGPPQVDPSLLPPGFTLLTNPDDANLALTALARDLLDEAYQTVELVRGRTISGMPKRVRTASGARFYGVPIGAPITRDMEERTASAGVEGKPFGAGDIRDPNGKNKTGRATLGGGPGAPAASVGTVNVKPATQSSTVPKRTYSHPNQPGVTLLDFGDGTVAIRDAKGHISARQRFDITYFRKLGWKVDAAFADVKTDADKAEEEKKATKKSTPAKKTTPAKK